MSTTTPDLLHSLHTLYKASIAPPEALGLLSVDIPAGHEGQLRAERLWHRASATQGNVTEAGAAALRQAGIWPS